jgi:hypothetical protein
LGFKTRHLEPVRMVSISSFLAAIFVVEDNGHAESTASSYSVGSAQVGRGEGLV